MSDQKLTAERLLIYLIGRLDEHERNLDQVHQVAVSMHMEMREIDKRSNFLMIAGAVLKAGWTFAAQFSTVFIASYVAFEHSWYVEKIGSWIHRILSFHF